MIQIDLCQCSEQADDALLRISSAQRENKMDMNAIVMRDRYLLEQADGALAYAVEALLD